MDSAQGISGRLGRMVSQPRLTIVAILHRLEALVQGSANQQSMVNRLGQAALEALTEQRVILSKQLDTMQVLSRQNAMLADRLERIQATLAQHRSLLGLLVEHAQNAGTRQTVLSDRAALADKADALLGAEGVGSPARTFELEGYVIIRNFLDDETARELQSVVRDVYALMEQSRFTTDTDPDFECSYTSWRGIWLQELPAFLKTRSPVLAGRLSQLSQAVQNRVHKDLGGEWRYFPKRSWFRRHVGTARKVAWHIDADAAALDRPDCMNVWLPVDAVGRDLPTLEIKPRSHWRMRALPPVGDEEVWRDDNLVDSFGPSLVPQLNPGDALVFDQYTLHRTQLVGDADMIRDACEFRFTR